MSCDAFPLDFFLFFFFKNNQLFYCMRITLLCGEFFFFFERFEIEPAFFMFLSLLLPACINETVYRFASFPHTLLISNPFLSLYSHFIFNYSFYFPSICFFPFFLLSSILITFKSVNVSCSKEQRNVSLNSARCCREPCHLPDYCFDSLQ